MNNYTVQDTNQMTWEEFNETLEALLVKLGKSGIHFDVVAPLLRSGGIIGGVLAIKMQIFTMLPVQFKYSYNPTQINQIISIPDILVDIPDQMNILLTEGNTSSGSIAKTAAAAIKEKHPNARVFLATLTRAYGGFDTLERIEEVFYGRMTDEYFKASEEKKAKYHVRPGIPIFPWEDIETELADINAA